MAALIKGSHPHPTHEKEAEVNALRRVYSSFKRNHSPRTTTLLLTEALVGVSCVASSLEILCSARRKAPESAILQWPLVRLGLPAGPAWLTRVLDVTSGAGRDECMEVTRLAAAATLLVAGRDSRARTLALASLTATSALRHRRYGFQSDGSEQLLFQMQLASATARLGGENTRIADACLWYISLQSALAYAVAGYSKLAGAHWRSGEALPGILRTETYGSDTAFRWAIGHPRAARLASHATTAGECLFPLIFFVGKGKAAPLFLLPAGVFHLTNSGAMGLGRFFWAFAASYPALLYTTQKRASKVEIREH
ncbi:hypothetical protein [Streptomyces sp. NPDC047976]|uniref:hypothetical protein n=1 Tax=Streptomyces sp. NPDC047976 TaxID=3155746 RepID=UPI003447DE0E